jgi:cell division protein FtsW
VSGRPVTPSTTAPGAAPDAALITAVALLAGSGLVMIHSTTAPMAAHGAFGLSPHFLRHAGALAIGVAGAAFVSRLPLSLWRGIALPLWLFAVALLVVTLVDGVTVNGAKRWLAVPGTGFRFQPVELVKVATVLAVATLVGRGDVRPNSPARLWGPALLAIIPAALLVAQPDMGNAVVLLLLIGALLFVAGAPLRIFAAPAVLGAAGIAAFVATRAYAWSRLTGFLDPWARSDAEGFQLVQSFVGFARGGLFGVGIGDGLQKLYYLPEAHTDFILALVAEELGLMGTLIVLGAFAALLFAGTRIARQARSRFALLLAFGSTALLSVPALVNAGVVMGLLPTKGLTLPFLSYGGTSLVVCCTVLGALFGIARHESRSQRDDGGKEAGKGARWR